ncbi:nucleoside diphosphate-linked moiety X motif 17 [Octopus vulgaris]|uniref:m7GpppN-mRNA hydrolase NUDT17 n=1 Tax=Octopus vulgaris TaxID=6645 RepID=A0AA36FIF5_OCTVU|nr:nucleoside diphosphate-linked moiety X motif 17 [Octopus vulgaris]
MAGDSSLGHQMTYQRVLVHLKHATRDTRPVLAKFTQCIVDYFGATHLQTPVYACLKNNSFIISNETLDDSHSRPVFLKHPSFCPILNLTSDLDAATKSRGIDVGVAVLLESSDHKLLLSRRANHLRIFPGIWVPPGGHIEAKETITDAGVREFFEETGFKINPEQCEDEKLNLISLWESVYPAKLTYGNPKRHHVVAYLHGKLRSMTSSEAEDHLQIEPDEVDACAWFDRQQIASIVRSDEEGFDSNEQQNSLDPESHFRAHILNENKEMVTTQLPLLPLLQLADKHSDCSPGRVSTGTKFALQQWLKISK